MQGLRLHLTNPKLAARSCDDCKKWIYIEEGPRAGEIAKRLGENVPRGNVPTPCRSCAKKSPEEAYAYELNDRSQQLVELYWQTQVIAVKVDEATCRYLGLIAKILKDFDDEVSLKMWTGSMNKGVKHD